MKFESPQLKKLTNFINLSCACGLLIGGRSIKMNYKYVSPTLHKIKNNCFLECACGKLSGYGK